MADVTLRQDQGVPLAQKSRYRDMGDGTHALVTAVGSVGAVTVPTGAPVTGQVAIAVTGTAVRLSAASVPLPGGGALIKALTDNTAAGTVGGAGVTNTVDGTGNGFILEAGDLGVVYADDLNLVYVNGTAGDIFSYSAT
jgi:hypothetical protein